MRMTAITPKKSLSYISGTCIRFFLLVAVATNLVILQGENDPLPPPTPRNVDFNADILPILRESCFQCHGQENIEGDYRLTSRTEALKEGDYGSNIEIGNSAESTLIQFVAHLEEDYEMPPIGKGDKLTNEEIGLLRAWIDQGLPFEDISEESFYFKVAPQLRFIAVDGNKNAFREHYWMRDGVNGGVQNFEWKQTLEGGTSFSGDGRITAPNDRYSVEAEIQKRDLGFFRFGLDQARTYDDPHGGYSPGFNLGPYALNRDLHLDLSNVWFEFGLNRPDLPSLTVGYEYRSRNGSKSMLQWGPAFDAAFNGRSIFPAWKRIDQETHIITLDLEHEWNGFRIQDDFRGEFYSQTHTLETGDFISDGDPLPGFVSTQEDDYDHFQGSNALTVEKKLKPWWLASGGYYYSHLDGDANLALGNFDPSNPAGAGMPFSTRGIQLSSESHIMNLNSLLEPSHHTTGYAGIQTEWTRRKGTGDTTFFGTPTTLGSNVDRFQIEENFGLRHTGIANTILYTDVRIQQESIGQTENLLLDDSFDSREDFMRDTDAKGRHANVELGTTFSPFYQWSFNPTYGYRRRHHDFNNLLDTDRGPQPGNGFPAAILERSTEGQNWGLKTTWKPVRWLKTSLAYEGEQSDYRTTVGTLNLNGVTYPTGSLLAGNFDSHTYRFTTTLTPAVRWFWMGSASYTDSRIVSGINDNNTIAPYAGDLYTLFSSWTFLYDESTRLMANYTFSHADYGQSLPLGLPMGSEFSQHAWQFEVHKQLSERDSLGFQYAYYRYRDDLSNGYLDYDAHGIFITWTKVFQ